MNFVLTTLWNCIYIVYIVLNTLTLTFGLYCIKVQKIFKSKRLRFLSLLYMDVMN